MSALELTQILGQPCELQVSGARCEGDYNALAAAASEAAAPTDASMRIARGCFRAPLDAGGVVGQGLGLLTVKPGLRGQGRQGGFAPLGGLLDPVSRASLYRIFSENCR